MLRINQLSKSYGAHVALNLIDLEVPAGVIFGILGPNGAGKTTLIRIINQIIEQDSGTVVLEDKPLSAETIRKIGYLPEERGLYKKMSVADQLIYFSRIKGLDAQESKRRVSYWLEKMDISSWKSKKIEDLSKGMAQKVQFIATVIHGPSLLILDEPFSGFDPVNAELVKNEILELKAQGTTILLSTHRMESVELLCDHVAMIHKSNKILDGTISEIKSQFRSDRAQVVLNKVSKELPSIWTVEESRQGQLRLSIPMGGQSPNQLLTELMHFGEVLSFQEQVPSMEQLFIQQVKANSHE
ncbi:MAG: ATP-binding cassette domain-containing protein [Bacteroidetes bacterium]|nr:ATP-binding cassette domain-containing protein [Bacteroidota bacterium]